MEILSHIISALDRFDLWVEHIADVLMEKEWL